VTDHSPDGSALHPIEILDLGCLDYLETHDLQRDLVAERSADRIQDTLILVEHPHVFTRGRQSKDDANILSPGDVPVVDVERGGDLTYHGPGQLVAYPIFKLRPDERDAPQFIRRLERWLIASIHDLGIANARTKWGFTGVWWGDKKLASIGIAVTAKWVTWHGIALNVTTDLAYFQRINPCGLRANVMTSVAEILGNKPRMNDTKAAVVRALPDHLSRGLPTPHQFESNANQLLYNS
jgi:lipoyl(octanoyl) transferase